MKKLITTIGVSALVASSLFATPSIKYSHEVMDSIVMDNKDFEIKPGGLRDAEWLALRKLFCESQTAGWKPTQFETSKLIGRAGSASTTYSPMDFCVQSSYSFSINEKLTTLEDFELANLFYVFLVGIHTMPEGFEDNFPHLVKQTKDGVKYYDVSEKKTYEKLLYTGVFFNKRQYYSSIRAGRVLFGGGMMTSSKIFLLDLHLFIMDNKNLTIEKMAAFAQNHPNRIMIKTKDDGLQNPSHYVAEIFTK